MQGGHPPGTVGGGEMLNTARLSSLNERMVAPPLPMSVPQRRECTSMRSWMVAGSPSLACTARSAPGSARSLDSTRCSAVSSWLTVPEMSRMRSWPSRLPG